MDNSSSTTSEYDIFHENIYGISKGISADLTEFATKAMEKNLIGSDKLKETLDSPKTDETATKLLLDLLPKIKQNESEFYKIRGILHSMSTCKTVVKMLQLQSDQAQVPPQQTSGAPSNTTQTTTATQATNTESNLEGSSTSSPQPSLNTTLTPVSSSSAGGGPVYPNTSTPASSDPHLVVNTETCSIVHTTSVHDLYPPPAKKRRVVKRKSVRLASKSKASASAKPPPSPVVKAERPPLKEGELEELLRHYKKQATIVVVGRSAAGKSTLINKVFLKSENTGTLKATPDTEILQTYTETRHGINLTIVDTVGLSQDEKEKKQQIQDLSKYTSGKADLVLFCIPVGPTTRFPTDNPQIMRTLQSSFGKDIWKHCLVVFTFSNQAWDHVKSKSDAVAEYKQYIHQYTVQFTKELQKLDVPLDTTVKTIFESANDRPTIVTIPAGYETRDPVLPGIQLDEEEQWVGALFLEMIKSADERSRGALLKFRYSWETLKKITTHPIVTYTTTTIASTAIGYLIHTNK